MKDEQFDKETNSKVNNNNVSTNNVFTKKVTTIVPCPTCQQSVSWVASSIYRPFCSERCRLIDLGEWASESYKIPESRTSMNGEGDQDAEGDQ